MRTPAIAAACLLLSGCGVFLDPTYERYLAEGLFGLEDGTASMATSQERVAYLAAAGRGGQVVVWDRAGAQEPWRVGPLAEGGAPLSAMSMGEDALALAFRPTSPATWCLDNEIALYDLAGRARVGALALPGCLLATQLLEEPTGGGAWLLTAERESGGLAVELAAYDTTSSPLGSARTPLLALGNRSDASVQVCPATRLVALSGPGETPWSLHRFAPDPPGLTSLWTAGGQEYPPSALAFDRTCAHLALTRVELDEVEVHALDGMDGLPEARIRVDGVEEGASLAFSPDGALLAVGLTKGLGARHELEPWLRVYEWRTGRQLFEVREHHAVSAVAFEADGRRLASGSDAGAIKLWDLERIRADAGL